MDPKRHSPDGSVRVAVVPPADTRKKSSVIKPFLRIVIASLFPLTNTTPVPAIVRSPVPAPIMNPGGSNVPIGAPPVGGLGPQTVFFPPIRIGVDPTSQLYVPPGSDGRITVLLKNDGIGDVFFVSGADDKNFFLQFDQTV